MRKICAFVALTALLFTGCGSSGDGGSGEDTDTTLSRQDFRQQAETICNRFTNEAKQFIKDATPNPTPAQIENRLRKLGEFGDDLNERLQELEAPEEDRKVFDEAIEMQVKQVDAIHEAEETVKGGDVDGAKKIVDDRVDGVTPELNEKFDSIGLERCGSEAGR
jgi:hypothetical protein